MLLKTKKDNNDKYYLVLSDHEFELFLTKFCGSLISRGRKDYALKLFDKILLNFKKQLKNEPFFELRKSFDNLIPILISTQKKVGKVSHSVPKLAVGNRRFVIMLNWIIKKQKGKTNVMGFKINDISRNLIDASKKKGLLMNLKKQHLAASLAGKHLLYTYRRRSIRIRRKRRINKGKFKLQPIDRKRAFSFLFKFKRKRGKYSKKD